VKVAQWSETIDGKSGKVVRI